MLLKSILEGSDVETSHEHSLSGGVAAPSRQSPGRHTKGNEDVSVSLLDTKTNEKVSPFSVYIYMYIQNISTERERERERRKRGEREGEGAIGRFLDNARFNIFVACSVASSRLCLFALRLSPQKGQGKTGCCVQRSDVVFACFFSFSCKPKTPLTGSSEPCRPRTRGQELSQGQGNSA